MPWYFINRPFYILCAYLMKGKSNIGNTKNVYIFLIKIKLNY